MRVLYRPQRGTLADAMAEVKEFSSIKEMLEYLVQDHKKAFDVSDVYISYYCYDDRIDWETFVVTVARYGKEKYDHPQAIGFCTLEGERALKNGEPICDYTKTDWNDCCECSAKDHCAKYNERSEIIGELLGDVIGETKNERR